MSRKSPSPAEMQWRTLQALQELEGTLWKEVRGELQEREIATWILLYEDSDVQQAHDAFARIVFPYVDETDLKFTVAYEVFVGDEALYRGCLAGTEEILSSRYLDTRPLEELDRRRRLPGGLFRSCNSKRD